MLSEAKHLRAITLSLSEMLHFVQHDNAFALAREGLHLSLADLAHAVDL
jgi:hypothetical protein